MRFGFQNLALAALSSASFAFAQQAAPGSDESHHHAVYEDSRVRVLDVQIQPGESIPFHSHKSNYAWIDDAGIHFSRGRDAHSEQNHAIIVELLQRQTGPRNVCGEVLAGEYLHCHEPGSEWLGANLEIEFETDQTRVGILRIAPDAKLAVPPAEVPPLLIPLEGTEAEVVSRVNGAPAGSSSRRYLSAVEVFRSPADHVSEVRNIGKATARFLVVEFGGAGE
jgi:hypothetical protein